MWVYRIYTIDTTKCQPDNISLHKGKKWIYIFFAPLAISFDEHWNVFNEVNEGNENENNCVFLYTPGAFTYLCANLPVNSV